MQSPGLCFSIHVAISFLCGISRDRLRVVAITTLKLSDLKEGRFIARFLQLSSVGWQEGSAHHGRSGTPADKGFVSACTSVWLGQEKGMDALGTGS